MGEPVELWCSNDKGWGLTSVYGLGVGDSMCKVEVQVRVLVPCPWQELPNVYELLSLIFLYCFFFFIVISLYKYIILCHLQDVWRFVTRFCFISGGEFKYEFEFPEVRQWWYTVFSFCSMLRYALLKINFMAIFAFNAFVTQPKVSFSALPNSNT